MSLTELADAFPIGYPCVLLLWLAAALIGLLARPPRPLLPLLVGGAGALLILLAALGSNTIFRLPLPWFLGAAGIELAADPLSRWFLGLIGLSGLVTALFSP